MQFQSKPEGEGLGGEGIKVTAGVHKKLDDMARCSGEKRYRLFVISRSAFMLSISSLVLSTTCCFVVAELHACVSSEPLAGGGGRGRGLHRFIDRVRKQ